MYGPNSLLLMLRGLYTVSLRSKGGHRGSNLLSWRGTNRLWPLCRKRVSLWGKFCS